jgi:hypothetical protein
MDPGPEEWMARSAAAICVASRWLSGAGLGLALVALWALPGHRLGPAVGLSLVAVAGAVQVYLALRIEFDRQVFGALARARAPGEAVKGFDGAMLALDMMPEAKAGRPLVERVRGLRSLVAKAGAVFALQLLLSLAAAWMR